MNTYRPEGQFNPEESEAFGGLGRVDRTVKALETNKAAVSVWFWKGLFALNLVAWSLALPLLVVLRFG